MNAERMKSALIASYTPARALLLWSAVILVAVLTGLVVWYAPRVFNAVAHSFEASAKQSEDVTGKLASASSRLDNIAAKVEARVDPILDNLQSGTGNLNSASESIKTRLPVIIDDFGGIASDVRRDTLPIFNDAADGAKRMIDNSEPNVTKATASIKTATASFAHSMEQIDARISDPKTARWIDEQMDLGHKVLLKVDEIAGKTVAMSSNGEQMTAKGVEIMGDLRLITKDSSEFVHGYLTAKPRWYQRFILTPLKAALGYGLSVYQITR